MKQKLLNKLWLRVGMIVAIMTTALAGTVKADTKTEGFETATVGNNYQGTVTLSTSNSDCGIAWQIYYGCVSTSNKISGNNSAALRLYTSDNYGYLKTTTPIDGLSNVTFKAKAATTNSASILINISYSSDGSSWTAIENDKALTTTSKEYSFDIPTGGKYFQIAISSNSTKPSKSNAQLTIDDVVFTYTSSSAACATPTFSPAAGAVAYGTSVAISCETDGATIYYTTDNSTPTTESNVYNSASKPTVTAATTFKAIAVKGGMGNSAVAEAAYTIAAPSAPTFSVAAGEVTAGTTVTITGTGTIRYTTNGVDPTSSTGTVYSEPVSIDAACTLKAICVDGGGNTSSVTSAAYTIAASIAGYTIDFESPISAYTDWTMTNVEQGTSTITAYGDTYYGTTGGKATASIQTKAKVANPGTFTCYVSKQSTNTTSSTWYIQYSADGSDWTDVESQSATSMNKGEWVEFTADLTSYSNVYVRLYYSGSTAIRNVDDIELTETTPASVATPLFDPAGDTYTTAQNVTITCATDGATIYYTTNGDVPTESSSVYSSPISVTTTGTTIKAIAIKGGDESSIASATYTIKPTTPTITAIGSTVTITGGEGCTFYYTLNGTNPTSSSTPYSAPFEQTSDCTIKAIAYDTYGNVSDVQTKAFIYFPLTPKNINSGYYVKVTDVNSLENGDAILIVNEEAEVAIATTQNANNRGQADVEILADVIYAPSAEVQKFVLVKNEDYFYFYTGDGYLYAASSGSNYLRTEENPDDDNNARATISISSGDATITFTGTNTRNWLKYNGTNTSPIFSCYASSNTSQSIVQIYKEIEHSESVTLNGNGYATFASNYAVSIPADGAFTAWQITNIDSENKITFEQVTGNVKAKTGLFLKGKASDEITIEVAASGEELKDNILVGFPTATNVADNEYYGLSGNQFVKVTAGIVKAGKALLPAGYITESNGVKPFTFIFEDDATGINEELRMKNEESSIYKQGSTIVNLTGQMVNGKSVNGKLPKGIYIVNGKKVLK